MKFFAVAVMASLAAVACNKDNSGNKDNGGNNNGGETEGVVIDGNFDDWAKLDAADVVTSIIDAEESAKALRTLKFYDTKEMLYGYAEVDPAEVGTAYNEAEKWDSGKGQPRPLRFVWDLDNNIETGGNYNLFRDAMGGDVLLDLYIYADAGKVKLGWSEFWKFVAEDGTDFLGTNAISQETALDNMIVTRENLAGSLVKGWYAVEFAIDKVNFPGLDAAGTVKVGGALLNDGWGVPGVCPSTGEPMDLNIK